MSVYEVNLETNVAPFNVVKMDEPFIIGNPTFIPDYRFHLVVSVEFPDDVTEADVWRHCVAHLEESLVLTNESVFEGWLDEYELFPLGSLVATRGITDSGVDFLDYVVRHQSGDWGDGCRDDQELNEDGLLNNDRIMSVYRFTPIGTIWIITEWDRSVTTVLLPEEY